MKLFFTLCLISFVQLIKAQSLQIRIPKSYIEHGAKASITNFFRNVGENIKTRKIKVFADSNFTTELNLDSYDSIKKIQSHISTIYTDRDSSYGINVSHSTEFTSDTWQDLCWNKTFIKIKFSESRSIFLIKSELVKEGSHTTYTYLYHRLKTEKQGSINSNDLEKAFKTILTKSISSLTKSIYQNKIPVYNSELKSYSSLLEYSDFLKNSKCDTLDQSSDSIINAISLIEGICIIFDQQINSEFELTYHPLWIGGLFSPCLLNSVELGLNPMFLVQFQDYLDQNSTETKLVLSDMIALYMIHRGMQTISDW